MSQSNVIVGCLFVAFVIYITMRGELPAYMSVLGISAGGANAAPSPQPSAASVPPNQGAFGTATFPAANNPFLAGSQVAASDITANPLGQSIITAQAPLLFNSPTGGFGAGGDFTAVP